MTIATDRSDSNQQFGVGITAFLDVVSNNFVELTSAGTNKHYTQFSQNGFIDCVVYAFMLPALLGFSGAQSNLQNQSSDLSYPHQVIVYNVQTAKQTSVRAFPDEARQLSSCLIIVYRILEMIKNRVNILSISYFSIASFSYAFEQSTKRHPLLQSTHLDKCPSQLLFELFLPI